MLKNEVARDGGATDMDTDSNRGLLSEYTDSLSSQKKWLIGGATAAATAAATIAAVRYGRPLLELGKAAIGEGSAAARVEGSSMSAATEAVVNSSTKIGETGILAVVRNGRIEPATEAVVKNSIPINHGTHLGEKVGVPGIMAPAEMHVAQYFDPNAATKIADAVGGRKRLTEILSHEIPHEPGRFALPTTAPNSVGRHDLQHLLSHRGVQPLSPAIEVLVKNSNSMRGSGAGTTEALHQELATPVLRASGAPLKTRIASDRDAQLPTISKLVGPRERLEQLAAGIPQGMRAVENPFPYAVSAQDLTTLSKTKPGDMVVIKQDGVPTAMTVSDAAAKMLERIKLSTNAIAARMPKPATEKDIATLSDQTGITAPKIDPKSVSRVIDDLMKS